MTTAAFLIACVAIGGTAVIGGRLARRTVAKLAIALCAIVALAALGAVTIRAIGKG